MTLLEVLNATSGYFEKHGVPQPRLNAELIIGDALGLKRLELYLQFERPVSEPERERLRPMVRRRAQREPLQHILAWTEFCGLRFACDPRALVPRPETELLVAEALQRASAPEGALLDVCTGSGVIAVAFLAQRPGWRAVATDSAAPALELARANAAALGVADRIAFHRADLWPTADAGPFAIVVSNPPYIASGALAALPPEVRADPPAALDGGADGLDLIRRIVAEAPPRIAPGGCLLLEIGEDQGPAVRALLECAGWEGVAILPDLAAKDRIAAGRRPAK